MRSAPTARTALDSEREVVDGVSVGGVAPVTWDVITVNFSCQEVGKDLYAIVTIASPSTNNVPLELTIDQLDCVDTLLRSAIGHA